LKGRQLSLAENHAVNPVEGGQLSLADNIAQPFLLCRTLYQDVLPIFYCKGVFNLWDEYHFDFITKVPVEACQMMKHVGLRLVEFEDFEKFARCIIWTQLESITILSPEQIYFSYHPPQGAWRKEEKSRSKLSLLMWQEVVKGPQSPKITRAVEIEGRWKGISDKIPLPDEVGVEICYQRHFSHLQTISIDLDQDISFLEKELKDLLAIDNEIEEVITPLGDEISSLQARIDQLQDRRNKLYSPLKKKRRRKTLQWKRGLHGLGV
jgi:hypothetical protein